MGHCLFMRKGEVHTAPVTGVLASGLAVGSTVKLMEGGTAVEYLVVNQGIPSNSNLYDASCDGTWLLRKDIHSQMVWNNGLNHYEDSAINTWLNGTFFNSLGSTEQAAIKEVKIPYRQNGGTTGTDQSGANGLSVKAFFLSETELGLSSNHYPVMGAAIAYFDSDDKRIAYLNGVATGWWTRAPIDNDTTFVCWVRDSGSFGATACNRSFGARPALILPSNAVFDETTMILKGVK